MATIEEALVYKMLHDVTLSALIDTRLYPLVVPQAVTLPAVAYQKISSPKEQAHTGSSHLCRSRVQFTCLAATYAEVKALAAAVKTCWNSYRGTIVLDTANSVRIDGCAIDNESDSTLERSTAITPVVRVDVQVWHYE